MELRTPIIIVNFKTYEGSYGADAVALARIAEKVASDTGASIAVVPNNIDLYRVVQEVSIPVLAQHVSPIVTGSNTGHVLPEAVKASGAVGTLINHAEKKQDVDALRTCVRRCKEVGLATVVCVKDASEAAGAMELEPDFIAVEPPDLIGGDVSVTTADKHLLEISRKVVHNGKLLCGAGVKTAEDVRMSASLGLDGVLLASGVVKAKDPEKALRELVSGLDLDA